MNGLEHKIYSSIRFLVVKLKGDKVGTIQPNMKTMIAKMLSKTLILTADRNVNRPSPELCDTKSFFPRPIKEENVRFFSAKSQQNIEKFFYNFSTKDKAVSVVAFGNWHLFHGRGGDDGSFLRGNYSTTILRGTFFFPRFASQIADIFPYYVTLESTSEMLYIYFLTRSHCLVPFSE